MLGPPLTAADAELFENAVVPRYLSFFGALVVEMLLPGAPSQLAHIGCRTGYPDASLADKLQQATIIGVDPSAAALELARSKAALHSGVQFSYQVAEAIPTPLPDATFTHAFSIHPLCSAEHRFHLLSEMRRLLMPGGQALIALPLRGSFPEINDMIREFALRQDLADLGTAVDTSAASRPTIETISEEFESAGLYEIDVDVQLIAISFNSGREFLEDPIARLMVFPEISSQLSMTDEIAEQCMKYLYEAISKYWSEGVFELTINVGCASGRRFN